MWGMLAVFMTVSWHHIMQQWQAVQGSRWPEVSKHAQQRLEVSCQVPWAVQQKSQASSAVRMQHGWLAQDAGAGLEQCQGGLFVHSNPAASCSTAPRAVPLT